MKVYKGPDFERLPNGTLFSELQPNSIDDPVTQIYPKELNIKVFDPSTSSDSYEYHGFISLLEPSLPAPKGYCDLEVMRKYEDDWDKLEDEMINDSSVSCPVNKICTTERCFGQEENRFLVWEKEDLEYLLEVVKEAISVADKAEQEHQECDLLSNYTEELENE